MSSPAHPFLAPLRLTGGTALPHRILPAPMEGITAGAFCAGLSRAGYVRAWVTPFLRVSTGVPRPARLQRFLASYLETGLPVVAQIMGLHPDRLAATAARLAELGAVGIDLNCACPSPTVLSHGAGGGRLRHPDWILATLTALRQALPGHGLSLKLRAGLSDPAELDDLLPALRTAPIDFAVLHWRTVAEAYDPVPGGWRRLARARQLWYQGAPGPAAPPFLGAGDVLSAADALRLHAETGIDGVAVARGLLRHPRLLRDIEAACAGRRPPAPRRADALRDLRDIARLGAARRVGRPGFVLEIARTMLGEADPLFRELASSRSLLEVASRLERVVEETVDDP